MHTHTTYTHTSHIPHTQHIHTHTHTPHIPHTTHNTHTHTHTPHTFTCHTHTFTHHTLTHTTHTNIIHTTHSHTTHAHTHKSRLVWEKGCSICLLESALFCSTYDLHLYPFCCKCHDSIFLHSWIKFHCIFICTTFSLSSHWLMKILFLSYLNSVLINLSVQVSPWHVGSDFFKIRTKDWVHIAILFFSLLETTRAVSTMVMWVCLLYSSE